MAVISHFRCFSCSCQWIVGAFTDPGSVPSNATYLPNCDEDDKLLFCAKCNAYKPPRAHHCSSCNRCIVRMDHHCPWINNCIGYRNMKFFVLFLVYTLLLCVYTFIMDICRLYYTYKHAETEDSRSWILLSSLSLVVILTMLTMSLACLFLGFTGSMLSDIRSTIEDNTTGIDRLKGRDYRSHRSGFRDYFGERDDFSIRWLFPILPRFFHLDKVRGYQVQLESFSLCTVCFRTNSFTYVNLTHILAGQQKQYLISLLFDWMQYRKCDWLLDNVSPSNSPSRSP